MVVDYFTVGNVLAINKNMHGRLMIQQGCSKMDYSCFLFSCWWFLFIKMESTLGKPPVKLVTVAIIQMLGGVVIITWKKVVNYISIAYTSSAICDLWILAFL